MRKFHVGIKLKQSQSFHCVTRGEAVVSHLPKILLLLHKPRWPKLLKEHPMVVNIDTLTISFCTLDLTVTSCIDNKDTY